MPPLVLDRAPTSQPRASSASPTAKGGTALQRAEEAARLLRELLAERGVNLSAQRTGHTGSRVRLPLQYFDSTDYKRCTPEAKVAVANERFGKKTNAVVLQSVGEDRDQWKLGRVYRYDGKAGAFAAYLTGEDGRVDETASILVPPLSAMFLHEKVAEFAQRLAHAHRARDEAEAELLLQFYVRSMPTTDVYTLSDAQIERLIERAVPAHRMPASGAEALARSGSVAPLIAEVKLSYARSMNGMLLRERMQAAPLKHKVRANLLLPPDRPPAPALGVVAEAKGLDFGTAMESFEAISSLVLPEACRAIVAARHECIQLARLNLFDLDISQPLELAAFAQLQAEHRGRLLHFLTNTWQPAVRRVVKEAMEPVDPQVWATEQPQPSIQLAEVEGEGRAAQDYTLGSEGRAEAAPAASREVRLSTVVNLMMSDAVTYLTRDSLAVYAEFVGEHMARLPAHVADPDVMLAPPLFKLDIRVQELAVEEAGGKVGGEEGGARGVERGGEGGEAGGESTAASTLGGAGEKGSSRRVLVFSTQPADIAATCVRVLDEGLAGLATLTEVDIAGNTLADERKPQPSARAADELATVALRARLATQLQGAVAPLTAFIESLRTYEDLLCRDDTAYIAAFAEVGASGPPDARVPVSLAAIVAKVGECKAAIGTVSQCLPDCILIGTFLVTTSLLKVELIAKHQAAIDLLMEIVSARAAELAVSVAASYRDIDDRLAVKADDIEAVAERDVFKAGVRTKARELEARLDEMTRCYESLEAFQVEIEEVSYSDRWAAFQWPQRLLARLAEVGRQAEEDRKNFQAELVVQQEAFSRQLEELDTRVANFHQYSDLGRVDKVVGIVADIKAAIADFEAKAELFRKREALFGREGTEYDELHKVVHDFEPYALLWENAGCWQRCKKAWLDGSFLALDPDDVAREFESMQHAVAPAVETFKEVPGCLAIAKELEEDLAGFAANLPVITALRTPGMCDRHWDRLTEVLKTELRPDDKFTLRDAIEGLRLHDPSILPEVQKVCEGALQEFAVQTALDDMHGAWEDRDLKLLPFRSTGTSVLKVTDEVSALLDEHIQRTQQLSTSPHKGPFEARLLDWERKMRMVQECICAWLSCQRNWMHLQPIFELEDTQRQLPAKAKCFAAVDRVWRKSLKEVEAAPRLLTFCDDADLRDAWTKANVELERVRQSLADHLEAKRAGSSDVPPNAELTSIPSPTEEPNAVQPQVPDGSEAAQAIAVPGAECEVSDLSSGAPTDAGLPLTEPLTEPSPTPPPESEADALEAAPAVHATAGDTTLPADAITLATAPPSPSAAPTPPQPAPLPEPEPASSPHTLL
jgi:dynein heavy chain